MTSDNERWKPIHEWGCFWCVKKCYVSDGRDLGRYAMGRGEIRKFATEKSAQAFADKLNKVKN